MQERRIDDCSNIDGSRDLSDKFHSVHCIGRENSTRIYVVWGETDKTASDIQARLFMASNAKLKEKQKWSNEKPKLDNARRLRGIYFVDPGDKEFKETILGMLERNWKHQSLPLCLVRHS